MAESEDESEDEVSMVESWRLRRTGEHLAEVGDAEYEESEVTSGDQGSYKWWSDYESDESCCMMEKKNETGEREESGDGIPDMGKADCDWMEGINVGLFKDLEPDEREVTGYSDVDTLAEDWDWLEGGDMGREDHEADGIVDKRVEDCVEAEMKDREGESMLAEDEGNGVMNLSMSSIIEVCDAGTVEWCNTHRQ